MAINLPQGQSNSWSFWVLCAFFTLLFAIGGGARGDVQSLILLRPFAALMCVFGMWNLGRDHIGRNKFLFSFAAALVAFVSLQLIPLPPMIWKALPGREIVSEIDRVAGIGDIWRPISMVPSGTWNALFSLLVPMAVLLVGVQLSRDQRFQLLPVLLVLGLASGFVGLVQVVGPSDGPLYFYQITNNGSAVGLFANRNHQAMLLACLFPMLAVYASAGIKTLEQARIRQWTAMAAGFVIVPLVLVTGSRAGLMVSVVALLAVRFLFRSPEIHIPAKRKTPHKFIRFLIVAFAVIGLGLLTILFARAQAFDRLLSHDQGNDDRFTMWPSIAHMAWTYFPIGSGIGSFVEIDQIGEPFDLLTPEYSNHAHNDWLEVYMTAGVPGLALIGAAVVAWSRASFAILKSSGLRTRDISFARLGSVIILIMALASLGDYPLRVPTIMSLMVVAALWLQGASKHAYRLPESESNRSQTAFPLSAS